MGVQRVSEGKLFASRDNDRSFAALSAPVSCCFRENSQFMMVRIHPALICSKPCPLAPRNRVVV